MKIPVIPARTCGTCTKCCEGAVHGSVFGHVFFKGSPCRYCVVGSGCSVYEDRPDDPCRTFNCAWITDDSIPEWMKPNISGAIVVVKKLGDFIFPVLIPTNDDYSINVLSQFILWGLGKYGNAVWFNSHGSHFYIGPPELGSVVNAEMGR